MSEGYGYVTKKSVYNQVAVQVRIISLALIMTILTFFVCTSRVWFPTRYFHNIQFIAIAAIDVLTMILSPILDWINPAGSGEKDKTKALSWLWVRQMIVLFLMLWFMIVVYGFYTQYRIVNNIPG